MPYLILLDKPEGITSFRAVSEVKRRLGIKRVGHTGTLDPMATGVLPLLTGRASRLSSMMLESDKRYTATVRRGITTDTLDITGKVLEEKPVAVSDTALEEALAHFKGVQSQLPPMYSALKKDGVRLYDLARQGVEVKREPRQIEIKELNLIERINETDFIIDVLCSKGTYIRSLASDIGELLGVGATLTALRRTAVSGFSIEECITLEDIFEGSEKLKSAEECVKHLREINVSEAQATRFLNGGQLDLMRVKGLENPTDGELLRVKQSDRFLGIGKVDMENQRIDIACIIEE